jgi:VRR-NUC domain
MTRTVQRATPLEDILERDWQRDVIKLAKTLGWTRIYHTFDSRRSTHGFPDLVIVRDRVLFLELKREKTKLTDEQIGWLRALRAAGVEAYVARPRHLEALAAVLSARKRISYELDAATRIELT